MPNTVCKECERFMIVHSIGVIVFEMADFGIYKIWSADEEQCPKCKRVVVSRWAQKPLMIHHQEGFQEYVQKLLYAESNEEVRIHRVVR